MSEYYALTKTPLPKALQGADGEFSIRTLSDRERLCIEDFFSDREHKISLIPETTAVVVPQDQFTNASLEEFAVLVEFALGVLSVSGFNPITIVATLNASKCNAAVQRSYHEAVGPPAFPKKLVKAAASTWIRHVFFVRQKVKGNLHITADRFGRYLLHRSAKMDRLCSAELTHQAAG